METGIKYQPKFGRVVIKREVNEKSKGGIIFPDAKRHANCKGIIAALGETAGFTETYHLDGDGAYQLKTIQTLHVGDKVIFGRHAGTWLDATYYKDEVDNDGTLFICSDQDILAVIKE